MGALLVASLAILFMGIVLLKWSGLFLILLILAVILFKQVNKSGLHPTLKAALLALLMVFVIVGGLIAITTLWYGFKLVGSSSDLL